MILSIPWNPEPFAVVIGPFAIRWYSLAWSVSVLYSYALAKWMMDREKTDNTYLITAIQYFFIGGVIGARLGHILFYQPEILLNNPLQVFKVWEGGLASHGGAIGCIVALWLFLKRYPAFNLTYVVDHFILVTHLPMVLIRLGNLMNSELVGKTTDAPWGFKFYVYVAQMNVPVEAVLPRHPTVLYEAITYLLIGIMMMGVYLKVGLKKPGLYTALFSLTILSRILLEFTKEPEGIVFLGLSNTQWLSVPFLILCIWTTIKMLRGQLSYKAAGLANG